jgi:hypothetical protein
VRPEDAKNSQHRVDGFEGGGRRKRGPTVFAQTQFPPDVFFPSC